ncbi:MAG: PstS family phosphate ABC transporter substrate-binding protein [Bdellovibrionota bacterium]
MQGLTFLLIKKGYFMKWNFVYKATFTAGIAIFPSMTQAADAKYEANRVRIDGSSTVFPITEAVAEEFNAKFPRIRVTVGVSGTGGGFKKFIHHEIEIVDASREIKEKEAKKLKEEGIEFVEIPIAYDGLSVVVNPQNDWASTMSTEQLKALWSPNSKVKKWSDINPAWPQKNIVLYGPGTDSGTFDYFTEAINGKSQLSRSDFTKSEDDNVLVLGVAGDKYALGYFGYAYYKENMNKVKAVAISEQNKKAVLPSHKTINDGSYKPLSRPLFLYIKKDALEKSQAIYSFLEFYLTEGPKLANEVGYVALPESSYQNSLKMIKKIARKTVANAR